MILINFKTYKESTGESAVSLTESANTVAADTAVPFILCPQTVDLRAVVAAAKVPVWAQHVDPVDRGRATGWFSPEVAKEIGVTGVLLNHSEHKLPYDVLKDTVARCRYLGLQILIFTGDVEESKSCAGLRPDYIGYEPAELIASKDTSVARAKPEVIEAVVSALQGVKVLVGAGVKDKADVETSVRLGAVAVGLASGLILAPDPVAVMRDLAEGFRKNS